jgi:hypothetical protein
MAHLKPDKAAASMIKINPHRLNSVAFATDNRTPTEMTSMIPRILKLGFSNLNAKANKSKKIGPADLHMVANVTVMKTRETLLKFISRAVAKPNGTTAHHIKEH